MSNEGSPPPTPTSPSTRRSSFSPGQLFGRASNAGNGGVAAYPTPVSTAAANAQAQTQQRRRLSISSLGLSGSPTQASAFANMRARQGSISSGVSNSTSIDENAIEEGEGGPLSSSPTSPFARRMSSGARALRDSRTGNANGRASTISVTTPSVKGRGLSSNPRSHSDSLNAL